MAQGVWIVSCIGGDFDPNGDIRVRGVLPFYNLDKAKHFCETHTQLANC